MKRLVLLGMLLAAGHAWAQPPEEVTATETIDLRVNEARLFRFENDIARITLAAKDVAEVIPESDRVFNMRGINQGKTLMIAYGPNGNMVYRGNIVVNQQGGYVKIYNTTDKLLGGGSKDYAGYYCNELGCGRADVDVQQLQGLTVQETRTRRDGTIQTITRGQ